MCVLRGSGSALAPQDEGRWVPPDREGVGRAGTIERPQQSCAYAIAGRPASPWRGEPKSRQRFREGVARRREAPLPKLARLRSPVSTPDRAGGRLSPPGGGSTACGVDGCPRRMRWVGVISRGMTAVVKQVRKARSDLRTGRGHLVAAAQARTQGLHRNSTALPCPTETVQQSSSSRP
jgi:hypothetical protein